MDAKFDNFAADVRGIAEFANPTNVLMYGGDNPIKLGWTVGPSTAIREMQTKAWENVVFPKMQLVYIVALSSYPGIRGQEGTCQPCQEQHTG
jgi:hypothetical protein